MKSIHGLNKKVLLVILDGFGINQKDNKNAILHAKKPNLDFLFKHYPSTTIEAGGTLVGLPKGVAGNSEVGHMNLGAGKSVRQDLVRINEAIANNTLKDLPELRSIITYAKTHSNRIHLMGLLSDGGVHSHINHLKELVRILSREKIELFLHALMDGRDTSRDSGIKYIEEINQVKEISFASIQGRSIGMDRDRRWNKIKECYETLIGSGKKTTLSPLEYIQDEYKEGRFDEFIAPTLFDTKKAIKEDDAVLFFNYRPDRAIEITLALTDPKFHEFKTSIRPRHFLCMTPYVQEYVNLPILFDKEKLEGTLSEYLSDFGLKQFKIAETEKYAHVTYFFNGGEKKLFPKEEQILIPSNREIATYDLKPEMSAYLILKRLKEALLDQSIDFYIVNFANSDMVGHTGNYKAAVSAIEVLDQCVGELMKECEKQNITMIVTADHGNSDQMVYENGDMHTSHTEAPVPFTIFDPRLKNENLELNNEPFALKDVAPTILNIMGLKKAKNFEGISIFK